MLRARAQGAISDLEIHLEGATEDSRYRDEISRRGYTPADLDAVLEQSKADGFKVCPRPSNNLFLCPPTHLFLFFKMCVKVNLGWGLRCEARRNTCRVGTMAAAALGTGIILTYIRSLYYVLYVFYFIFLSLVLI